MSSEANVVLEQYRAAVTAAADLESQVFKIFMALPSLEEKLKFVIDNGFAYLKEDSWYCPHVRTSAGEVSLYDDLYWERRQTYEIDRLYEMIFDDMDGPDIDDLSYDEMLETCHAQMVNHDSPAAAVLRDMLTNGIGTATHDW